MGVTLEASLDAPPSSSQSTAADAAQPPLPSAPIPGVEPSSAAPPSAPPSAPPGAPAGAPSACAQPACGRGQPGSQPGEAGQSPLSVTDGFAADATDGAAGRKPPPGPPPGATAAAPLPRSKLPTFKPLPLVHSGISGDLDSLLVKDMLEEDAELPLA